MRIPNTAEVLTFFAAIGQFSNLQSADSEFSLAPAVADIADSEFSSVIPAGADDADLEYSLAPSCARAYTVEPGDNCYSIAAKKGAPTYQILCQNDQINGKCNNLGIGQNICLGLQGEDCNQTFIVTGPSKYRHPQAVAKQFNISYELYMDNNYCYYAGPGEGWAGWVCPPFQSGTVVCIAQKRVRAPGKCAKIF